MSSDCALVQPEAKLEEKSSESIEEKDLVLLKKDSPSKQDPSVLYHSDQTLQWKQWAFPNYKYTKEG